MLEYTPNLRVIASSSTSCMHINKTSVFVNKPDMSELKLFFYTPTNETCSVNAWVARLDGPFCHVEMQFPNGLACSIVMDSTVRLIQRTFDPCFYTGVRIKTSKDRVQAALKLAREVTQAKVGFGFYESTTPAPLSPASRTYCSKLMRDILRQSEIMPNHFSATLTLLTPSALYRNLLRQPHVVEFDTKCSQSVVAIDIFDSYSENQSLLLDS